MLVERSRRRATPLALVLLAMAAWPLGHATAAEADKDALIANALSAAPPTIARTATVKGADGKVLRQGNGAYTCFPREKFGGAPICIEKTWEAWVDARKSGKPFAAPGVGIAYMLAGDAPDGGASNTDPQAKEPAAHNHWIVEGPHVMIIVPDLASLGGLPDDPAAGEPYVMWKGTPLAHIMAPVGERPPQRPATH